MFVNKPINISEICRFTGAPVITSEIKSRGSIKLLKFVSSVYKMERDRQRQREGGGVGWEGGRDSETLRQRETEKGERGGRSGWALDSPGRSKCKRV